MAIHCKLSRAASRTARVCAWYPSTRVVRGAMHSGERRRSSVWLMQWWTPFFLFFLNPVYVAACSLRSLLRNKVTSEEMWYQVRCLKSNEDMILALAGQFKQLSHEPEKFRWLNGIRTRIRTRICDSTGFEYIIIQKRNIIPFHYNIPCGLGRRQYLSSISNNE